MSGAAHVLPVLVTWYLVYPPSHFHRPTGIITVERCQRLSTLPGASHHSFVLLCVCGFLITPPFIRIYFTLSATVSSVCLSVRRLRMQHNHPSSLILVGYKPSHPLHFCLPLLLYLYMYLIAYHTSAAHCNPNIRDSAMLVIRTCRRWQNLLRQSARGSKTPASHFIHAVKPFLRRAAPTKKTNIEQARHVHDTTRHVRITGQWASEWTWS